MDEDAENAHAIGGVVMRVYGSADVSMNGLYRYRLDRWWGDTNNRVGFLMMNPSTADATDDDATIRKCIGFARKWNYGGLTVVNLYPYRAREPVQIFAHWHESKERNLAVLKAVATDISGLVCAWGCASVLSRVPGSAQHIRDCVELMAMYGRPRWEPMQIAPATVSGMPRHPLMPPYTSGRLPYEVQH